MILRFIFQSAALTAVHTGVVAGIAASVGSENPAAVGFTSFAVGIPSLIAGAFIGDALTPKPTTTSAITYHQYDPRRATIGGLIGYATGSAVGFSLKYFN